MAEQDRNEVFIDADSGFSNEKDSYEALILFQMKECIKVLSREMTGGQVIFKAGNTGTEKYIEDVRELVINNVDTLRMLISFYIKGDNKKQLDTLKKEIEDYKTEIMEKKILVPGKGEVPLKNIKGMAVDSPIWKEYIHYKATIYREIFEVLVNSYNAEKAEIRAMENE
jgi:hypothetical protein